MPENEGAERDLSALELPQWGRLRETGDPYQLIDKDGLVCAEAQAFFKDLQTAGREDTTLRSYALDLLRFLWVLDIRWDQATRCRGEGLHALDAAGRQARARALAPPASIADGSTEGAWRREAGTGDAESGDGQVVAGRQVRGPVRCPRGGGSRRRSA
ncbi:hypothetical protein [Streptomyces sp. NPDC056452]|uniref:hypothetical protein n=1 Tax=Streptomyces sp. NPDC056452 TaxID=3345821 RepID=UPI0036CA405C